MLTLAVGLGAFGAHGLKNVLDEKMLEVYKTANFYHFVHALGLLAVPLIPASNLSAGGCALVCWLLCAGILIFSGSLYALAVTNVSILGAITPIGGLFFLAAWITLAWKITAAAF